MSTQDEMQHPFGYDADQDSTRKLPPDALAALQKVADENCSEITDDLTVQLAIELAGAKEENRRLRNALRPFADCADPKALVSPGITLYWCFGDAPWGRKSITMGNCYDAVKALGAPKYDQDTSQVAATPDGAAKYLALLEKMSRESTTGMTVDFIPGSKEYRVMTRHCIRKSFKSLREALDAELHAAGLADRIAQKAAEPAFQEFAKNIPQLNVVAPVQSTYEQIVDALRAAFPHFEGDQPISADMIRAIGREHHEMILGWEPVKDRIEFIDGVGASHAIVFDPGDDVVNDPGGWVLEGDDADKVVVLARDIPELRPEDGSLASLQSRADGNGESCAQFCRAIEHALSFPMGRDAKRILHDALRMSWLLDLPGEDLKRSTSAVQPLVTEDDVAKAIYEQAPVFTPGEKHDGNGLDPQGRPVAPRGALSWSAANNWESEAATSHVTAARSSARALLEKFWIRKRGK